MAFGPILSVPRLSAGLFLRDVAGDTLVAFSKEISLVGISLPATTNVSWDVVTGEELDHPGNYFDSVILVNLLEDLSAADRPKLVKEGLRIIKPGGRLFAISRACDDGNPLMPLLEGYGLDLSYLKNGAIIDAELVSLKPDSIVYLEELRTFKDRSVLLSHIQDLYVPEATLENMWRVKFPIEITRFEAGLTWKR